MARTINDAIMERDATSLYSRVRDRIREILRCYNNRWDLFSELLQNSVDAIHHRYNLQYFPDSDFSGEFRSRYGNFTFQNEFKGSIRITVDLDDLRIIIEDNGIGIAHDRMCDFLLPEVTGKTINRDLGFKGYGLTFSAFTSDIIEIISKHVADDKFRKIMYKGLYDWTLLSGESAIPDDAIPSPKKVKSLADSYSTLIKITPSQNNPTVKDIFEIARDEHSKPNMQMLEYVLRTKTALGNTKNLVGKTPLCDIEVHLRVVYNGITQYCGESNDDTIPYKYMSPLEVMGTRFRQDAHEFGAYLRKCATDASYDNMFKALHFTKDIIAGTNSPINCACYSLAIGQMNLSRANRDIGMSRLEDLQMESGILLSIDGMPTGISLEGWGSYGGEYKRYYIVVDAGIELSDALDSGRKTITHYRAEQIRESAINTLDHQVKINGDESDPFKTYCRKYLSLAIKHITDTDFAENLRLAIARRNNDLSTSPALLGKLEGLSYLLHTPMYEQETIHLFVECLHHGLLKGFKAIFISSGKGYDIALEYKIDLTPKGKKEFASGPLPIPTELLDELETDVKRMIRKKVRSDLAWDFLVGGRIGFAKGNHAQNQYAALCGEFKPSLCGLISELKAPGGRKQASEMDIVIVWEVGDLPSDDDFFKLTKTLAPDDLRIIYGQTHVLTIDARDIFVISLKDLIELQ